MKIESLPTEIATAVKKSSNMTQYLHNLAEGRPATPRSWLYESKSANEILSDWMAILSRLKDGNSYENRVFQFDTSQLKKWGPQGKVAPIKELMETVEEGFKLEGTPKPSIYKDALWQRAKELAIKILFKDTHTYKSLRPLALANVVDNMAARDTLESNSGFPSFTTRKNRLVIRKAIKDAQTGTYLDYPAIALFRNYNQKTRLVWMYPMATNLVEGSFAQPLKEVVTDAHPFFAAWKGYELVLGAMSAEYNAGMFLSASDFSHTDAHFRKWQVLEVYDVIKYGYQEEFWPALKQSLLRVTEIPLLIGEDTWIRGAHGVSSGSIWTNDVETYHDFIAELYLSLTNVVLRAFNGIGDDVCHVRKEYDKTFSSRIADIYARMGFDVNPEKVTNEPDYVKYLQRLVQRNYTSTVHQGLRGVYSTIRALNSSVQPEKFHKPRLWSKNMFAVRQFMILENCVDHPLFAEFVKFIGKGNEYLPKFAKLSANRIDSYQARAKLLPGLNPTYNQEKRDKKMSSFLSIKMMNEAF